VAEERGPIEWGDAGFDSALKQAAEGIIDARGVRLTEEQLDRLLDDLPEHPDHPGSRHIKSADFRDATLLGLANFERAIFNGAARFDRAQFTGQAWFDRAQFSEDAQFEAAQFTGQAWFGLAQFSGEAEFTMAHFTSPAGFVLAQFSGNAEFGKARFSGPGLFNGAEFSGGAEFGSARFARGAEFEAAVFRERINFGPLLVSSTLSFDQADFDEDVELAVSASAVSCCGTRFGKAASLDVRWAEVALDDAVFRAPSRLDGVGPFPDVDDSGSRCRADARRLEADARPRIVSLRQADVGNLTLGNVDLRACRFFGAHGLDKLRIEADCQFGEPPRGWRHRRSTNGSYSEYDWRYARRRMLAEEHHWRASRGDRGDANRTLGDEDTSATSTYRVHSWHPPECRPPSWLTPPAEVLKPARIAPLYRALRKALEDVKDEPEAGDFYYGEMEMRRHERETRLGERVIIWPYWLVSGYGLRASRALFALAFTIIVLGAIPLAVWGFRPAIPYGRALLFALQSSISLLRAPTTTPGHQTAGGQVIEIFLRLAGPLFFGLALLALRGRVKR
jgi:uncharacterized protein YjbI with pentapeptide repeats